MTAATILDVIGKSADTSRLRFQLWCYCLNSDAFILVIRLHLISILFDFN
jgi:hypothetical protein